MTRPWSAGWCIIGWWTRRRWRGAWRPCAPETPRRLAGRCLALAETESGEALEGLAEALYLDREYAAAAAHYERAYAAYRRQRATMAAGRAARAVAWITGGIFGDWAVRAAGWPAPAASWRRRARIGPSTAGC